MSLVRKRLDPSAAREIHWDPQPGASPCGENGTGDPGARMGLPGFAERDRNGALGGSGYRNASHLGDERAETGENAKY